MWGTIALRAAASLPWGRIVVVAVTAPLLLGLVIGVSLVGATVEQEAATTGRGDCYATVRPSGLQIGGLDDTQLAHAATIIEVGRQKGVPVQGIRVALMTAAQESTFRNYANDGSGSLRPDQRDVSRSLAYPHDAVGRDHGSVNVFQQQYPWWGTLDELMDPRYAAGTFYDALLTVPGWQQLPPTAAAQRVQRSAFPTAYARWEPLADELLAGLGGPAVGVVAAEPALEPEPAPGPGMAVTPSAPASSAPGLAGAGLQQSYQAASDRCATRAAPAGFTSLPGADVGQVAVNVAASWIGTPYAWGGGTTSGPSQGFAQGAGTVGFDCSGLVLHAWYQAAGIRLPHSSVAIEAMGTPVSPEQAQAGDVLSFSTHGGGRVSHDGLYDGRGGMVHAPRTGKDVEYVPDILDHPYWASRLISITRPPVTAPDTRAAGDGAGAWSVSGPRRTVG